MKRIQVVLLATVSVLFMGCGLSPFVEPKSNPIIEDRVGAFRTMATTGERRIVLVRSMKMSQQIVNSKVAKTPVTKEEKEFASRLMGRFGGKTGEFCAEPSPDAIESLATAFGAAFSASSTLPDKSKKELQASLSRTLATSAASVFRRTQGIQLYRDGAFFLCQAMMNGYIDAAEYQYALFRLREDAVDLVKAEFATEAWKTEREIIVVPAPNAPTVVKTTAK